jgi:hypothetical protein
MFRRRSGTGVGLEKAFAIGEASTFKPKALDEPDLQPRLILVSFWLVCAKRLNRLPSRVVFKDLNHEAVSKVCCLLDRIPTLYFAGSTVVKRDTRRT